MKTVAARDHEVKGELMRLCTVLAAMLAASAAAAEPAPPPPADSPPPAADSPPPAQTAPPPAETAPPPVPPTPVEPAPPPPPTTPPPINITITNNNNGNNSNTNTQTNTAPVTVTTSTPVTVAAPPTLAPPSYIDARPPPVTRYQILGPHAVAQRWLMFGLTKGHHETGVRGSLDLFSRGHLALGIAGSAEHERHGADMGAVAYLAWTRTLGRFDLRAQIGLGVGGLGHHARGHGEQERPEAVARTIGGGGEPPRPHDERGPGARAEASVLLGLPLGKRLGLVVGPVISAERGERHREIDAQLFGGLRLRF